MQENEMNFEEIINQLIEKIEKPSIKNVLKSTLVINRITSDTIECITISKMAQLIFNNIENLKYIEEKLSEVMGKPTMISVKFENKEAYFDRKIENI